MLDMDSSLSTKEECMREVILVRNSRYRLMIDFGGDSIVRLLSEIHEILGVVGDEISTIMKYK